MKAVRDSPCRIGMPLQTVYHGMYPGITNLCLHSDSEFCKGAKAIFEFSMRSTEMFLTKACVSLAKAFRSLVFAFVAVAYISF